MLEELRSFLAVLEEGSLRRAAKRLRISQPSLTRQMQLLEHDLGGRLLERSSAGVRPTSEGHALADKARSLLANHDSAMAEIRRFVRGESDRLRIGLTASTMQQYLKPGLTLLRRTHPKLKIKMVDQMPTELIAALRRDEIDLALTAYGAEMLSHDYYTRKLTSLPSLVVLPFDHRLASEKQISISQLKNDSFAWVPEDIAPGRNQMVVQLCRQFGKFRPRFVRIGKFTSAIEGFMKMANEGAITLGPSYIAHLTAPNVVTIPIAEKQATWDLFVVWQRGKASGPLRALVDALTVKSGKSSLNPGDSNRSTVKSFKQQMRVDLFELLKLPGAIVTNDSSFSSSSK
jgi:DNA-binding transcriptional LysR family regulator